MRLATVREEHAIAEHEAELRGVMAEAEAIRNGGPPHVGDPQKLRGDEHPDTVADLCALAGILDGLERWDESEPMYRRALVFWERLVGPDHTLTNLATLMRDRERLEEGRALATEAQRILQRSSLPEEHPLRVYADEVLRDLAHPYERNEGEKSIIPL